MKNEISHEQVELLFTFVKRKYVRYKDVQFEIVDHLASGIEEIWEKEPHRSFESALSEIYGKFPIPGFAVFVREKQKAMMRFWRRKIWQIFIEYMSLPKVILTLAVFTLFYAILLTFNIKIVYILIFTCSIWGYMAISKINQFIFHWKIKEQYLVIESFSALYGAFTIATWYPFILLDDKLSMIISGNISIVIFTTLLTTYTLSAYVFLYPFPKILKQELNNHYSHLKLELAI